MMGSRRGRRGSDRLGLLPIRSRNSQYSSTVSCWYSDYKFFALNEPLFRFGRRYSRCLRVWFSMGTGFSVATLLGVTLIILYEFARSLLVYTGKVSPSNSLSWFSSLVTGSSLSLSGIIYLIAASIICAFVHEFGHAIAAASEGIHMEYLAVFWAVLFPGALVAFDDAVLQASSRVSSLRIYCAGIWHNATFCAVCTMALFLLPLILNPFYIYGQRPMVLDVPSTSPLSGYLSPLDVIQSIDDIHIHTIEDWRQTIKMLSEQPHQEIAGEMLNIGFGKGYCVPHSLIEESTPVQFQGNQTKCLDEVTPFASISCLDLRGDSNTDNTSQKRYKTHCLEAKDVVKLKKCSRNTSSCLCSEDEYCSTPVQLPGHGWVEIIFSSLECGRSLLSNEKDANSCFRTFVFVGDLMSMAHSVRLTSYQPRWPLFDFAVYLPNALEKFLTCSFHVSLVIALLNSLPVFSLDGESILEVIVNSSSFLSSRRKRIMIQCCLLGGTFISTCFLLQTIFLSVI